MTTAWYGKSPGKQIQNLIEHKPSITQLLNFPQFIQQLKSYNTKLLDYITNNPSLIGQAIELITLSPKYDDTNDRKFKYPLQVIQMIQTQTTCILNSFFKEINTKDNFKLSNIKNNINSNLINNRNVQNNSKSQYFDILWRVLQQAQMLPILAGYFFRTNICLLNNRYKQTLDRVYINQHYLSQLLNHANHMSIVNTIQLYLNLDINKSSQSNPNRLDTKINLINKILAKIDNQRKFKNNNSAIIIQNLITVLIETIQKYYLILDGKNLVDILTSQHAIEIMLILIKQNWQASFPAFNFFISLINYYSFSSFNADDTDPQKRSKNLQKLQSQPMVIGLKLYFPNALQKIMKASTITLYEYKLLQIICHCISISSQQFLKIIKQKKFFGCLINLMFKHEQNNILHMLIQKSFLHVFISQRKIYDEYKRHLFCQLDIIQLTANRVFNLYKQDKIFEQFKKKIYFGHFMRILKIYSGIQTTQEVIINSIKSKTDIWNKISSYLIKPYQTICFKQLGTYQNIPEGINQQFIVTKSKNQSYTNNNNPKPLTTSMIEQIRKQDQAMPTKKQQQFFNTNLLPNPIKEQIILEKIKQQELLKAPTHNLPLQLNKQSQKQIKKTQSFKQFMTKKKQEAQQQIRLKRSLSHEKRLSGSKGKITNLSPKKNNWTQKSQEGSQNQKSIQNMTNFTKFSSSSVISKNKSANQLPRIPLHYSQKNTSLNVSSNQNLTSSQQNSLTGNIQQQNSISDNNSGYKSYFGSSIQNRTSNNKNLGQSQNSSLFNSRSANKNKITQIGDNKAENNQFLSIGDKSKSQKNIQILKKIKVIQIQAPKQKRYRRIQQKDKILLDFLGIKNGVK